MQIKKASLTRQFNHSPLYKKVILLSLPVLLTLAIIATTRCAVVLGDQVVAVALDKPTAKNAVESYLKDLEQQSGLPVTLQGHIKYQLTWKFWAVANDEQIQKALADKLDCKFVATGIYIDQQKVAVVKNTAEAQQVLDELLNTYNNNGAWQASFKQKVAMRPIDVYWSELMPPEEVAERIRYGGEKAVFYQIKSGDTMWDVASAHKVSVEQLLASNPHLNPDNMQIGQQINISQSCPLLDVICVYQQTSREQVPFRVQEKVDQSLYYGEQKIVQKGEPGEKEVVYDVALENGIEMQRKIVQQKIITEPVHQVVAKGEKKLLAFRGGNTRLAYPTVGGINSGFGNRNGRFHSGVDIAAGYGSPVVAAEAGTVIKAGSRGNYGLCVDVSHGGGVVTRYAHLSSIAVKPGQRVDRSQFIGRVGSTGNSTGPHLHFEVIVNGAHKNPSLFI